MKSYYEILEIDKTSTSDQIKKAYRKLAMVWHPDKHQNSSESTEKFQKISEAYACLIDDNARQHYDNPHSRSAGTGGFTPFNVNLDDMIRDMFAQQHGGNWHQQKPKNRDIQYHLSITLEDAFKGKSGPLKLQNDVSNQINVTVPAGADSGQRIKFTGKGDTSIASEPPGDAYVLINVLPHGVFQRQRDLLFIVLPINSLLACIGTTHKFIGIDGLELTATINPGTQHGDHVRLLGQGMTIVNQQHRGDLIIEIHLQTPAELTIEQKTLIETILKTGSSS